MAPQLIYYNCSCCKERKEGVSHSGRCGSCNLARSEYAKAALTGLLASPPALTQKPGELTKTFAQIYAAEAFEYADAMLEVEWQSN